ncbi:MAG: alkane 1-monooxygenase [Pseudomonadota bacterium]
MTYLSATKALNWRRVLPFWSALALIPLTVLTALLGGWMLLALPLLTWHFFSLLDAVLGLEENNLDPSLTDRSLELYTTVTMVWAPLQFGLLYWLIWYATGPGDAHLSIGETIGLFFGMGVVSGTVGINFAHELMHQSKRTERGMADALLAMVLYSHFRSEHLLVHHRYVGTPKDPVTARYNEGFHRFFPRVLRDCFSSSFQAEATMQERRGRRWYSIGNPFWLYLALQTYMIALATVLGGWVGLALFFWQALVAIWQLELINYIEHYGLTRRHLGGGKYEHVQPHHSWNATHKASNWLLINLQRHSDHHFKPARRFPLLQNYDADTAPHLPRGYPIMALAAMVPPIWRRTMNPLVRDWRRRHYPDITDWSSYNSASHPLPR